MIVHDNADAAWRDTIRVIVSNGKRYSSRAGDMVEVLSYGMKILNPNTFAASRKFSPVYAAGELLWYLSRDNCGDMISHYAPSYSKYLETDVLGVARARGGYGARIRWTLGQTIKHLLEKLGKNTRQAVIPIFNETDVDVETNDCPCTLTWQFLPRADKLHMITTMRSNDAWLGLPYDLFCFTRIQSLVADAVGLDVGTYTHQVGSMHLYEKDVDKAREALSNNLKHELERTRTITDHMSAIELATTLEKKIRNKKLGVASATKLVADSKLYQTFLGQMLVLCAMKNDGSNEALLVDPALLEMMR